MPVTRSPRMKRFMTTSSQATAQAIRVSESMSIARLSQQLLHNPFQGVAMARCYRVKQMPLQLRHQSLRDAGELQRLKLMLIHSPLGTTEIVPDGDSEGVMQ
jgi:hypothetical protein